MHMKDSERQGFFLQGWGWGFFFHDIHQFKKSSFCTLREVIFFTRRRGKCTCKTNLKPVMTRILIQEIYSFYSFLFFFFYEFFYALVIFKL